MLQIKCQSDGQANLSDIGLSFSTYATVVRTLDKSFSANLVLDLCMVPETRIKFVLLFERKRHPRTKAELVIIITKTVLEK